MATLAPDASADEIEEELDFTQVLIDSLDPGSDDFANRLAELEQQQADLRDRLERMLNAVVDEGSNSGEEGGYNMNGNTMHNPQARSPQPVFYQNGIHHSNGSLITPQTGSKRPATDPLRRDDAPGHLSKRQTPQTSAFPTPASSRDSSTTGDYVDRMRRRQLAAEAAMRRQRENEKADELYARELSGMGTSTLPGPSSLSSSQRPNFQTTLGYDGSFARPPPLPPMSPSNPNLDGRKLTAATDIKSEPTVSNIKSEPGSLQRSTQPSSLAEVVDLTVSEEEDNYTTRITARPNLNNSPLAIRSQQPQSMSRPAIPFSLPQTSATLDSSKALPSAPFGQTAYPSVPFPQTQSNRSSYSAVFHPGSLPSIPGSYPGVHPPMSGHLNGNQNGYQPVYGNTNYPSVPSWMQRTGSSITQAAQQLKSSASWLTDPLNDLGNLMYGSSSRPSLAYPVSDDEATDDSENDLVYGGSRPLHNPYANNMALFHRRYEEIADHNPEKTREEINALLQNIRPDEDIPADLRVKTPEAMSIKLHKYQELGLTWLKKCEEGTNKGGILADDMGLGKTIQMLSLIVEHKSTDPRCKTTLIVAPVALMRQWKQEIEQKIKPGRHKLSVFIQHGPGKKKRFADLRTFDIVLTTYGTLGAELKKAEAFQLRKQHDPHARPYAKEVCALLGVGDEAKWYRVILDEAQCIKNKSTQAHKAACFLVATYRFAVTGTPMMNSVEEFYALVKWLRINPYCRWEKFKVDIATGLKSHHDDFKASAMSKLQALCKAVMLRRTKKSEFEGQPILVLPERTTEVENPEFDAEERALYEAIENKAQLQFNRYLRRGEVVKNYASILVMLLRLRQAACHPHLIKDFGIAGAADISEDAVVNFAKELEPAVVERIRATEGNFECPVCYDVVENPAIFIPCGHDTCRECFTRITDPSNAIRNGNDEGRGPSSRCPNCRSPIDPKRVTDFEAFKRVHMPELLTEEEKAEADEQANADSSTESEEDIENSSDEETDSDDEVDAKGNLANFVVNDDVEDSETESEDDRSQAGLSDVKHHQTKLKMPSKGVKKKSQSKKGKGKEKKKLKSNQKHKKAVTLADLAKVSQKNAKERKKYLRKLRDNYVDSAKIRRTMELLETIVEDAEGEKILVFSQWTSLLDLLEIPVDEKGWGYRRYDGSMNAKMRGDAVDDFRDHRKNIRIMLVSLKAGNAGLNLNMASQVIILDPFWNPYIEEQAIDRAHRIGQERPVKVHRILVAGTVEDRIIELQERKRALISEALDEKASQSIGRLGVRELAYLFGITANPTQAVEGG